jgi:hypothetical protein
MQLCGIAQACIPPSMHTVPGLPRPTSGGQPLSPEQVGAQHALLHHLKHHSVVGVQPLHRAARRHMAVAGVLSSSRRAGLYG